MKATEASRPHFANLCQLRQIENGHLEELPLFHIDRAKLGHEVRQRLFEVDLVQEVLGDKCGQEPTVVMVVLGKMLEVDAHGRLLLVDHLFCCQLVVLDRIAGKPLFLLVYHDMTILLVIRIVLLQLEAEK